MWAPGHSERPGLKANTEKSKMELTLVLAHKYVCTQLFTQDLSCWVGNIFTIFMSKEKNSKGSETPGSLSPVPVKTKQRFFIDSQKRFYPCCILYFISVFNIPKHRYTVMIETQGLKKHSFLRNSMSGMLVMDWKCKRIILTPISVWEISMQPLHASFAPDQWSVSDFGEWALRNVLEIPNSSLFCLIVLIASFFWPHSKHIYEARSLNCHQPSLVIHSYVWIWE